MHSKLVRRNVIVKGKDMKRLIGVSVFLLITAHLFFTACGSLIVDTATDTNTDTSTDTSTDTNIVPSDSMQGTSLTGTWVMSNVSNFSTALTADSRNTITFEAVGSGELKEGTYTYTDGICTEHGTFTVTNLRLTPVVTDKTGTCVFEAWVAPTVLVMVLDDDQGFTGGRLVLSDPIDASKGLNWVREIGTDNPPGVTTRLEGTWVMSSDMGNVLLSDDTVHTFTFSAPNYFVSKTKVFPPNAIECIQTGMMDMTESEVKRYTSIFTDVWCGDTLRGTFSISEDGNTLTETFPGDFQNKDRERIWIKETAYVPTTDVFLASCFAFSDEVLFKTGSCTEYVGLGWGDNVSDYCGPGSTLSKTDRCPVLVENSQPEFHSTALGYCIEKSGKSRTKISYTYGVDAVYAESNCYTSIQTWVPN